MGPGFTFPKRQTFNRYLDVSDVVSTVYVGGRDFDFARSDQSKFYLNSGNKLNKPSSEASHTPLSVIILVTKRAGVTSKP